MGILTKEVDVTLNQSKMISYYENKGYYIPRKKNECYKLVVRKGTKIKVKIGDLSYGSTNIVKCECDGCNKIYTIPFYSYNKQRIGNLIYCQNCTYKIKMSGENHPNWNFNKTNEEREFERKYTEYINFVKRVMARDNYTCQYCESSYSDCMEVHHLDGYSWCKEKRTDDKNGITLCKNCHKNFHSIYGYGNNTKSQFEEWIEKKDFTLEYFNGDIPTAKLIYCIETKEINFAKYFAEKNNVYDSAIYGCCNKNNKHANKKHFLWYDEYKNMTEDQLLKYIIWTKINNNNKIVICINDKTIYSTITKASKINNCNRSIISGCCKGKYLYTKKYNTGEKLKWMYLDDYIKLYNESILCDYKSTDEFIEKNIIE